MGKAVFGELFCTKTGLVSNILNLVCILKMAGIVTCCMTFQTTYVTLSGFEINSSK